jgi:hypothetical protein
MIPGRRLDGRRRGQIGLFSVCWLRQLWGGVVGKHEEVPTLLRVSDPGWQVPSVEGPRTGNEAHRCRIENAAPDYDRRSLRCGFSFWPPADPVVDIWFSDKGAKDLKEMLQQWRPAYKYSDTRLKASDTPVVHSVDQVLRRRLFR